MPMGVNLACSLLPVLYVPQPDVEGQPIASSNFEIADRNIQGKRRQLDYLARGQGLANCTKAGAALHVPDAVIASKATHAGANGYNVRRRREGGGPAKDT